jgi:hypothetical protein
MPVVQRLDFSKPPNYSAEDKAAIASECGIDQRTVAAEISLLEDAVDPRWQMNLPDGWQPSKVAERLGSNERMAVRLLEAFGITDPDKAIDGPPDECLFRAFLMGLPAEANGDELRKALGDLASLGNWAASVAALANYARSARLSLGVASPEERATTWGPPHRDDGAVHAALRSVTPGNTGNAAYDDWLLRLGEVYRRWTGNPPTASWDRVSETPTGFTLFALLAGRPLGITEVDAVSLKNRIYRLMKAKK